jgi:hypothetical protein
MRVNKRHLFSLCFGLVSLLAAPLGLMPQVALAASCPNKPYLVADADVSVAGEYSAWVLQKSNEGTSPSVYISADEGKSCTLLDRNESTTNWQWVAGANGIINFNLEPGKSAMRIYVDGGTTNLARLLLTLDNDCVPEDNGNNCVAQPLQITIGGLQQGSTVAGDINVQTYINTETTENVRVDYFFDSQATAYSTSNTAPYCLVMAGNGCGSWSTKSLPNGQHSLTVRASSASSLKETTITFTINNASPVPSPAPTTPPAPTYTTGSSSPIVRPVLISNSENRALAQSTASATGTPVSTTSTTPTGTTTPIKDSFVAGLNIKGQIKGKVVVTPPKELVVVKGDKLELIVDGQSVEIKTVEMTSTAPTFILDTTKYKNGKVTVAIKHIKVSGETSTYNSDVEIVNGVASTVNTAKRRWPSVIAGIVAFVVFVIAAITIARYIIQKRQFTQNHILTEYSYVQPQNPYYAAGMGAAAVLLVVFGFLYRGTSGFAANVGYILSLPDSQLAEEFNMANDPATNIAYVILTDSEPTNGPGENVDTGHENHSPNNPTNPRPPSAPIVTGTDYNTNLAMMLNASSRNRAFDNPALVNTPSVDLYDNPTLYGHPDDYNVGHFAYNPGTTTPGAGMFRTECAFSHFNYDDPIVYPGQPGAAHLHMNFGNTHTNAYTDYNTLINSGNATCSGMELNRTGYWAPAMMDQQGNARVPHRVLVYYKGIGPIAGKVIPYPENLQFLAKSDISLAANSILFACNYNPPHSVQPVNCPGNQLHMIVAFPRCLRDGADPADYLNNWVTQEGGWWYSDCPAGSKPLPQLEFNIFYPVDPGEDSSTWFLSSDVDRASLQKTAISGSSLHGDWFGGWNKEINQEFLDNCLNNLPVINSTGAECGFGSLVPCIQSTSDFVCQRYASGLPMRALKAIRPDPGYNKVPLNTLHREVCPQAPLPDNASVYSYAYCATPR